MNDGGGGVPHQDFDAGPDQVLVVYQPPDVGTELDPFSIFGGVAADAVRRAVDGFRVQTMTSMPLRHAGAMFGNDGSGYQTKVAVAVVYARVPRATG